MDTRARKSSEANESEKQEAEALSSPAALRLDWLKRDCSQSSMRGTSETIARIPQPYNIRVAHKLITTLRRLLTNVKDKDKQEDRQGNSTQDQLTSMKPAGTLARDWPNTNEWREKWWRPQSHCWTPFTGETSNQLRLCDMYYLFYRLLSTTLFGKLVYELT